MKIKFMMMTFVLVALCAAREILRKEDIAPFQLKIGSVDSFSSALFVEVKTSKISPYLTYGEIMNTVSMKLPL